MEDSKSIPMEVKDFKNTLMEMLTCLKEKQEMFTLLKEKKDNSGDVKQEIDANIKKWLEQLTVVRGQRFGNLIRAVTSFFLGVGREAMKVLFQNFYLDMDIYDCVEWVEILAMLTTSLGISMHNQILNNYLRDLTTEETKKGMLFEEEACRLVSSWTEELYKRSDPLSYIYEQAALKVAWALLICECTDEKYGFRTHAHHYFKKIKCIPVTPGPEFFFWNELERLIMEFNISEIKMFTALQREVVYSDLGSIENKDHLQKFLSSGIETPPESISQLVPCFFSIYIYIFFLFGNNVDCRTTT